MLTVEGVYKNGHIELLEDVGAVTESKVIVTFVENDDIELSSLGIDNDEAMELRAGFESFDDWNDPAMDIYNDYDNARSTIN